jgi:hypothetical protein
VLATDISSNILAFAERSAREAGLRNVDTRVLDGEQPEALERAGFTDVEARRVAAPLRLPSTAESVRFARESFGALHQMLAGLSEAEREEAWREIERELSRYETAGCFEGPCELLVAAGTAPA